MDRIKIADYELSADEKEQSGIKHNTLEIVLRYEIGGYGGFDWTHRPRGYQLSISPCTIATTPDGYKIRSSVLLGGQKESGGFVFIEETKRKSQKRMQQLADAIDCNEVARLFIENDNADELIDYVKSFGRDVVTA